MQPAREKLLAALKAAEPSMRLGAGVVAAQVQAPHILPNGLSCSYTCLRRSR